MSVRLFSVVESVTYRENGYRSVGFECPRCRRADETVWPVRAVEIVGHSCTHQGCRATFDIKIPEWCFSPRTGFAKVKVDRPRTLVDESVLAALRGESCNHLNDNAIDDPCNNWEE